MSMFEILDRPIAFHRVLVDVTGSITAAVMLSQAIYWQRRVEGDEWFYKTQEDWREETGMTRREQETARKILSAVGVMQEERRGVPAKLFFRLDVDRLEALLIATIKNGGKRQSGMAESAKQVGTNPPSKSGGIRQTIKGTKTTTETTAEITTIPDWLPEEVWQAFVVHRKAIKAPLTDKAVELAFRELSKLHDAGHDPVAVIEQSILNSWKGLFPIKRGVAGGLNRQADLEKQNHETADGWVPPELRDQARQEGEIDHAGE